MQEEIILRKCILWCKKSESDRSKKNKNLSLLANLTIKPRLSSEKLPWKLNLTIKNQSKGLIFIGHHRDIEITAQNGF